MKKMLRMVRRILRQPRTVRQAKINAALWGMASTVAVVNIGLNVWLQPTWLWFWLAFNTFMLFFDVSMLRLAVIGLLWRKEQDEAERRERLVTAEFWAIALAEYKRH